MDTLKEKGISFKEPMPRTDGPFEVLKKINDNAYKVDLPADYGVSATFNIADFSPYQADDSLADLSIKSF